MTNRRILFVDDDAALLGTYTRLLGRTFEVMTAEGPDLGLEAVEKRGPFAVIVSDLRMPRMNGIEFLARTRAMAPESTRVMLTGCADATAAAAAVNEGHIFRFLTKPCLPALLVRALEACVEQYRLVMTERELLEKTLDGSVRVLTEILGLTNPGAVHRANRIRQIMGHLARQLGLPGIWQYELAGLLSQIGCLTISPEILDKVWAGQELTPEEAGIYGSHPAVGRQLLGHIPRLESVAHMIAVQLGDLPASEPGSPENPAIVRGGLMLRVAVCLDQRLARGFSLQQALMELRRLPLRHHPELLAALERLTLDRQPSVLQMVRVDELKDSMVFAEDVHAKNGMLLVAKGHEVSMPVKLRLKSFAAGIGVVEPIRVLIPDDSLSGQSATLSLEAS